MARFVPDVKTRRWVIIAPERSRRPYKTTFELIKEKGVEEKQGFSYKSDCPFCFGNEGQTPPEIYRWGASSPEDPHWLVRVIPNKYPITDIHEVIIHSPDHIKDFPDFENNQIEIIFRVFRERFKVLSEQGQVLIFCNSRRGSGISLIHPHSQVVVVPNQINLDVLSLEPIETPIYQTNDLLLFAPDFSQWPYELWIARKKCCQPAHKSDEEACAFDSITDEEIKQIAWILKNAILALEEKFPHFPYNFYISPKACWYLRIIPRLVKRAGFELGTGLSVNIYDPLEVSEQLKKAFERKEPSA